MKKNNIFIVCALAICMVAASPSSALANFEHVVKKGETIYGIAYKYNISPEALLEANPQANEGVRKGMLLVIPSDSTPASGIDTAKQGANDDKATNEYPYAIAITNENRDADKKQTATDTPAVHVVVKGDSFYSIGKQYGITVDRLIQLNPFDDPNNLLIGKRILLTDGDMPLEEDKPSSVDVDAIASTETVDEPYIPVINDTTSDEEVAPAYSYDEGESDEHDEIEQARNIMILLPFMANNDNPGKSIERYRDFYRGFLLAANELNGNGKSQIKVIANDLSAFDTSLSQKLDMAKEDDVKVIITPEDDSQLHKVIKFAEDNDMYALNMFNFKDDAYRYNPHVLQGNITGEQMLQKAVDYALINYSDFIPVIIDPVGGKDEKAGFVSMLTEGYAKNGIEPITLTFDGELKNEDFAFVLPNTNYLFIPKSGAVSVFNKFIPHIISLRNNDVEPDRFTVFGYPDWTAFRGGALDNLHKSNAVIYSRFDYNYNDNESKMISDEYRKWYEQPMIEAMPSPAILGYDTAKWLIETLQGQGLNAFLNNKDTYNGVQSSFTFDHPDGVEGYTNEAMYIIEFGPGTNYSITTL